MSELAPLVYYLVVSLLLTHEMDAVHKCEWRLLFLLRKLDDATGRTVFILLHIPLLVVLLWLSTHSQAAVQCWTMISIDIFAVIHAGLHWRLTNHPDYAFYTPTSKLLIYGAAFMAIVHMVLLSLVR